MNNQLGGQDKLTQAKFEDHEVRPQALEWLLSQACGRKFSVSCDNLAGDFEPDHLQFQQRVHQELISMLKNGIPPRGLKLIENLQKFYQTKPFSEEDFPYPETIWDI